MGFRWIPPMEPLVAERLFSCPDYVVQAKWDGLRCAVQVESGEYRLWSRRGRDRTQQYPEFQSLPEWIPAKKAILDAELVMLSETGVPEFADILGRDAAAPPILHVKKPALLLVFDVLAWEGNDWRERPLEERLGRGEDVLMSAVDGSKGRLRWVTTLQGTEAPRYFEGLVQLGWEGIVYKRRGSAYRSGKSEAWLKHKKMLAASFPVAGVVRKAGQIRSLLLGERQGADLVLAGRVSSGLGRELRSELEKLSSRLRRPTPPLTTTKQESTSGRTRVHFRRPSGEETVEWWEPLLEAEVHYHVKTAAGLRDPRLRSIQVIRN